MTLYISDLKPIICECDLCGKKATKQIRGVKCMKQNNYNVIWLCTKHYQEIKGRFLVEE